MRDYHDENGTPVALLPLAGIRATLSGGIEATGDVSEYSIRQRLEIELLIRSMGLR